MFFPLTTAQPGNLIFRETRAWSRKDLAQETTTTLSLLGTTLIESTNGDAQGKGLFGASTPDHWVKINNNRTIMIEPGGNPFIEGVWIRLGNNIVVNPNINVSYSGSGSTPSSPYGDCKFLTFDKVDGEELYFKITPADHAKYIIIAMNNSLDCTMSTA